MAQPLPERRVNNIVVVKAEQAGPVHLAVTAVNHVHGPVTVLATLCACWFDELRDYSREQ
jgi:hypothetical protein